MTAWPTRAQFFAAYHAAADPEPTRAEVMAEVWSREREAVRTLAGQLWPARPEFQWHSYPPGIDLRATVANADDLVTTLLEFARAGQREEFDFLASSSGVTDGEREELWTGTRRRLGLT